MNTGEDLTGTGTEQLIGGSIGLLKGNKRNHSGVRLIDELMVDIMGGLIPGVLFNFSIIVCILLPILIYEKIKQPQGVPEDFINNHFMISGAASSFGGWFWFAAFLTFLILSYIAGHIFYRSDINIADSKDIERRKGKNANFVKDLLPAKNHIGRTAVETIQKLLISELSVLQTDKSIIEELKADCSQESNQLGELLEFINGALKKINESDKKDIFNHETNIFNYEVSKSILHYTLLVLFPQNRFKDKLSNFEKIPDSYADIINPFSLSEKSVLESYRKETKDLLGNNFNFSAYINDSDEMIVLDSIENTDKFTEYGELLIACYLILSLQNDSGCTDIRRLSDYPYLEYYKYLLKRNEVDLIRYVDWSPAGARTKNKINRMKIDIQLDYPDAYAILNKNESHVRMAASSWHVSGFITNFAVCCVIGIIGIAILYSLMHIPKVDNDSIPLTDIFYLLISHLNKILVITPPVLLFVLMKLMRGRIEDFIHYQRLREIFFTLFIYKKLNSVKNSKCVPKENASEYENNVVVSIAR